MDSDPSTPSNSPVKRYEGVTTQYNGIWMWFLDPDQIIQPIFAPLTPIK